MRFVFKQNIYSWIMTGIIGKDGKWFLGFSKVAPMTLEERYAVYVEQATQLGWTVKSFDEWLNS